MELKNCPFCGGEKITIEGIEVEGITWYRSKCITCFSEGQIFANESETASAWNTRVDLKPLHDLADEFGKRESAINVNAPSEEEKAVANAYGFCEVKLCRILKQMEGE